MNECQKCEGYNAARVILCGGYSAMLCCACENDWHKYVINKTVFVELQDATIRGDLAFQAGDVRSALIHHDVVKKCKAELFTIAEKWIDE